MRMVFATRPSSLARTQTRWVIQALQKAHPSLECVEQVITTQGDQILHTPLPEIGGKGLFTLELENALLAETVDCAVHSLKDLPIENTPGLTIGVLPPRADARDVLISAQGHTLSSLPAAAPVGTSSLRRAAQLLALRPDLQVQALRGNVDTRLRKALEGQVAAILLAGAGLSRLGLEQAVTQWLPLEVMLPAPGQGALAVQCRADDQRILELLAILEDAATRQAVTAERQFLLALGGGCSAPVAAYASLSNAAAGELALTGRVLCLDGSRMITVQGRGQDALQLGQDLARQALQQGAADILSQPAGGCA